MNIVVFIIFFFTVFKLFSKNNNIKNTFYVFSLIFFVFFFIIPFIIFLNSSKIEYVGITIEKTSVLTLKIFISITLFISGFIIFDLFNFIKKSNKQNNFSSKFNFNYRPTKNSKKILIYLTFTLFLYYLFLVFKSDRSVDFYEVKQTREGGSWLTLFLSITMSALKYGVFFSWLSLKKDKIAIYVFAFMFFIEILGGIGRTDLLLGLLILIAFITKIKSNYLALTSFILIFVSLPILINLKGIIYSFTVKNELPTLTKYFFEELNYSDYLNNFGHPFVSLLVSDDLVKEIDYRYFYDYIQGFLFFGKIIGLDFGKSLTYYNTKVILGYESSIIPPGYLSFGYLQFQYLGVFIAGLTYRYTGIIVEKIYQKLNFDSNVVKVFFAFIAANTFYHGDIRILVMTFILPITLIAFIIKKINKNIV